MRLIIRDTPETASKFMAKFILDRINSFGPTPEKQFVLGLPTGSSPEIIYRELVRYHEEGKLSFRNVVTFNMDEYVGIPRDHPQSYHTFMYKHLFSHIDIQPHNVHILDGMADDLELECRNYEALIASKGGIDLFLGGVGPSGHVAFNEPGSSLRSATRLKTLAPSTVAANARFFDNDAALVPRMALTVGVQTVMAAREVAIIATGANKALAVKAGVEGAVNHSWTISRLQEHPRCLMVIDEEACGELTVKTVKYFKEIEQAATAMGIDHALGKKIDKRSFGVGPKL